MQIHQPIPHGLLYSVDPHELAKFHLSDNGTHDDFEWGEYDAEHAEESLATNVISFLKEITGCS
jgi:hypothetical protein